MMMGMNKRVQKYGICLIAISVSVLYILSLVGCISTSPGIPGLFLVKLSNNATKSEVRVGLFGICAGTEGDLSCGATIGQNMTTNSSNALATQYLLPGTTTTASSSLQSMLAMAAIMQGSGSAASRAVGPGGVVSAVYVPLVIGFVFFTTAVCALLAHSALPDVHYGDDPGKFYESVPRARAWQALGVVTTYSVAASLAAAVATTGAGRALLFAGSALPGHTLSAVGAASKQSVVVKEGTALAVLQWLVVALTLLWHLLMTFVWRRM